MYIYLPILAGYFTQIAEYIARLCGSAIYALELFAVKCDQSWREITCRAHNCRQISFCDY